MIVLLPVLGIVALDLWRTTESYREGSLRQLSETAGVVSRAVTGELEASSRLLAAVAELHAPGSQSPEIVAYAAAVMGEEFSLDLVGPGWLDEQLRMRAEPRSPAVVEVLDRAGASGRATLSNIIMIDGPAGPEARLVLAVPGPVNAWGSRVASIVTPPAALIRALSANDDPGAAVVLAVTDGNGRILARSRDSAAFIGRPVPDWEALVAQGRESGSLSARTLEGGEIIFAYHRIPGTPGWVAVVGEPRVIFEGRWMGRMQVIIAGTLATILGALVLAMILAQKVLRPIRSLADRARLVVEQGGAAQPASVQTERSFVAEFDILRESLDQAEAEIRREMAESARAMQEALASKAALEQAERIARLGNWSLDLESGLITCSNMLDEMNGRPADADPYPLAGLASIYDAETHQRVLAAITQCAETGGSCSMEVRHRGRDRAGFPAHLQMAAIRDENGRITGVAGTVLDVTELRDIRDRLAALADNLPDGVIYRMELHPDGRVAMPYLSAGIERLTGLAASDLMADARPFYRAMLPEDLAICRAELKRSAEQNDMLAQRFRLRAQDGRLIWMQSRAAPRQQGDGRVIWDGILSDVSAEHAAAESLKAAKDAAESAERAKSDFLAAMSHEIRTPMNSVVGMTRLMLRTDLDQRQRNYLEKIDISAQGLLGIINDILDFSKIEAGRMELEETGFELEAVLRSVSAVTALKAEEKDLEIAYSVAPDVPASLRGDPLRLGQVLTNLVGNAVKFTDAGEIVISIRRLDDEGPEGAGARKRSDLLEFSVRDSGIGMTEDQIGGLFRPFAQAGPDTSRRYGGTGLGLAICRRLVGMMGGEIGVESRPGHGTTFRFTVAMPAALVEAAPRDLPDPARLLAQRRVLIVDDNASARHVLEEMTLGFGMEARAVSSGAAALELLHAEALAGRSFDIVLLDWRMPHMDGLETARRIRADEALLTMPAVLMVTAFGQESVLAAVEEIGLEGVLMKPVTQSVMFDTMVGILAISGAPAAPAMLAGDARMAGIRTALAGRRVLVVDDNAFNREVAGDFLELVGIETDMAVNGLEAIRLMEGREYDAVLLDMHMPVMDGLTAVREIRLRPGWASLPVIALTAQARDEDHRASATAGMSAHLSKPIDEFALYATLMELLPQPMSYQRRSGEAAVLPEADLSEARPDGSAAGETDEERRFRPDLDRICQRFGGNRDRALRMIRGFLRDFADIGTKMAHAHAEGRLSDIGALAHQVRGSAGYFGAEDCAASAAELEGIAAADPAQDPAVALVHFLPLAEEVLAALAHMLAAELPSSAPAIGTGKDNAPADTGNLLDLLRRAIPLVAAGDLSARALLESLTAGLAAHPAQARAAEALELFEDLELSASLAALHLVEADLTAASAGGPASEGGGGGWRASVGTLRSDPAREAGIVPEARA